MSLPLFRKATPSGSHRSASAAVLPFLALPKEENPTASGMASPSRRDGFELCRADSLEQFHQFLRRHHADRIFLDLLQVRSGTAGNPTCWTVVLSACRGRFDIIAILPFIGERGAEHPATEVEAMSYLDVLRSRFLFLGYSTSDGLASARLADSLPRDRRSEYQPG